MIASVLQVAGIAAIVTAALLVAIPLGIAVAGALLLGLGLWIEAPTNDDRKAGTA